MQHPFARLLLVLCLALAGCGDRDADRGTAHAATVVDSAAAAREAELAAFRRDLPEPSGLASGTPSAEALVRAFVRAVEERDSSAFAPMLLTRAEFAWLYYPTSPLARPPYDLPPDLMWFQLIGNSERGLRETLELRGGRSLGYVGFRCDPPVEQGRNRFHGNCAVRRRAATGEAIEERLFGALLERDGRWKFVSYSSRL